MVSTMATITKKKNKKPRAVQEQLPNIDTRKREPVAHHFEVDISSKYIGASLGNGLHVFACPTCGKGCIPKREGKDIAFAHKIVLQSMAKTVKWSPVHACKLGADALSRAVARGSVTLDKDGQVIGTRAPKEVAAS